MFLMRVRPLLRASCKTLVVALLLAGRIDYTIAQSAAPQSGDRLNIREQVKAGRLNKCITDASAPEPSQPRLLFRNHCDGQVNVSLCVRVANEPRAYYLILMAGRSDAQQMLWIPDGAAYRYKFNSCDRPYCTPPEADC